MTHVQDAIFEHEMFSADARNTSYSMEGIRKVEATWDFHRDEIEVALRAMISDGLVTNDGGYWKATTKGKSAREKRWQQLGLRQTALTNQVEELSHLILALVVSGGEIDQCLAPFTFFPPALGIYLGNFSEEAISAEVANLTGQGFLKLVDSPSSWAEKDLMATADGHIQYAKIVVPSLGLQPPRTILSPISLEAASSPFDKLGFSVDFTHNLQLRWEEAARCRTARAWLSVTVLYGSILEAVLLAALQKHSAKAVTSSKFPKGTAMEGWNLASLLDVAADIGLVEPTLARYGHALRDTRNLIHPQKQIRENKYPDEAVAEISSRVVHGVIDSLPRFP